MLKLRIVAAIIFAILGSVSHAQSDFETELAKNHERTSEAGAMCIAASMAVQDVARANNFEDLKGSRSGIGSSIRRLAGDQDHLDEHALFLRAIYWRDTFFKPAAEIVIPLYVAGETEPEDALNVMREGQNQCQEWHRHLAVREMMIARHEASK